MIDMKLTPQQAPSATLMGGVEANEGPTYPYGLTVEIRGEALKRLGFGPGNLPQVGQKMDMKAMVEVIEVCKEEAQIETEYCVELQIQAMSLGDEPSPNEQQRDAEKIAALYKPA